MTRRPIVLVAALCAIALHFPAMARDRQTPVSAKENPANWFPLNSYPAEAKRKGEQGRVTIELTVSSAGLPMACRVVESSGFATLDAATCELALANAKLVPAKDATGQPVESTFTLPAIRWALNDDYTNMDLSAGPVSNVRNVEIMVDEQGKSISCRPLGGASDVTQGCENFRPGIRFTPPLLLNGTPVAGKVTITTTTKVEPK